MGSKPRDFSLEDKDKGARLAITKGRAIGDAGRGAGLERLSTANELKILTRPDSKWINKPAEQLVEKTDPKLAV